MTKYRLAVLASHPIQNQTPLFRLLAKHPEIDITVFFCSDHGTTEQVDPGFGVPVKWDVPLLDGYRHRFLPNLRRCPLGGFASLVNPAIMWEIGKGRYDAVLLHGHTFCSDWMALLAARSVGTAVFYRSESSLVYDSRVRRSAIVRTIKPRVLRFLFSQVTRFLTVGTLNRRFYLHYGARPEHLFHVPYSVDNEYIGRRTAEFRAQRTQIRVSMGIDPRDVVFLFAAKMTPKKAPLELLQAYRQLKDTPNSALILAGDGELKLKAEEFARQHQLPGVHFVGFVNQSELPKYYAISDVFVRPDGIYKGDWGLTVNEAMAAGLAVVASDSIGATTDLVKSGENGIVVRFGDIEELASAMRKLASRPALCEAMGRRSLEINQTWSYVECVDGILAALRSLTTGGTVRGSSGLA